MHGHKIQNFVLLSNSKRKSKQNELEKKVKLQNRNFVGWDFSEKQFLSLSFFHYIQRYMIGIKFWVFNTLADQYQEYNILLYHALFCLFEEKN